MRNSFISNPLDIFQAFPVLYSRGQCGFCLIGNLSDKSALCIPSTRVSSSFNKSSQLSLHKRAHTHAHALKKILISAFYNVISPRPAEATLQASVTSMATPAPYNARATSTTLHTIVSQTRTPPSNTFRKKTDMHGNRWVHGCHVSHKWLCRLHTSLSCTHTHTHNEKSLSSAVIKDHLCRLLLLRYNKSCSPSVSTLPLLLMWSPVKLERCLPVNTCLGTKHTWNR